MSEGTGYYCNLIRCFIGGAVPACCCTHQHSLDLHRTLALRQNVTRTVEKTLLKVKHCPEASLIWMVPAQEVEEAMTDQPMQFIVQAVVVVLGLS
jgi:hypothetical protein